MGGSPGPFAARPQRVVPDLASLKVAINAAVCARVVLCISAVKTCLRVVFVSVMSAESECAVSCSGPSH